MRPCPHFNVPRLHAQDFKLCSFKFIKCMTVQVFQQGGYIIVKLPKYQIQLFHFVTQRN